MFLEEFDEAREELVMLEKDYEEADSYYEESDNEEGGERPVPTKNAKKVK